MICPLQPIMLHKRQNSLRRYYASEGKIALRYFASGDKIDKTAICLAGHGGVGLEKNTCRRSTGS